MAQVNPGIDHQADVTSFYGLSVDREDEVHKQPKSDYVLCSNLRTGVSPHGGCRN
jgi:hypothetical protein